MSSRAVRSVKAFLHYYMVGWLFLLWGAFCACLGASWFALLLWADLKRRGIL